MAPCRRSRAAVQGPTLGTSTPSVQSLFLSNLATRRSTFTAPCTLQSPRDVASELSRPSVTRARSPERHAAACPSTAKELMLFSLSDPHASCLSRQPAHCTFREREQILCAPSRRRAPSQQLRVRTSRADSRTATGATLCFTTSRALHFRIPVLSSLTATTAASARSPSRHAPRAPTAPPPRPSSARRARRAATARRTRRPAPRALMRPPWARRPRRAAACARPATSARSGRSDRRRAPAARGPRAWARRWRPTARRATRRPRPDSDARRARRRRRQRSVRRATTAPAAPPRPPPACIPRRVRCRGSPRRSPCTGT